MKKAIVVVQTFMFAALIYLCYVNISGRAITMNQFVCAALS